MVELHTNEPFIGGGVGCEERRIAGPHENMYILGAVAAEKALAQAGKTLDEVANVYVAHNGSDEFVVPHASAIITHLMEREGRPAVDIGMGCSGGINAVISSFHHLRHEELSNFERYLFSKPKEAAPEDFSPEDFQKEYPGKVDLVIVTDLMSRYPNWRNRVFSSMASDAAAAVVLESTNGLGMEILHTDSAVYGGLGPNIILRSGMESLVTSYDPLLFESPSHTKRHYFEMDGPEVHKFVIRTFGNWLPKIWDAVQKELETRGRQPMDKQKVQLVSHQPNDRSLQLGAPAFGVPIENVYREGIRLRGNTSGASAVVAFDSAREDRWLLPDNYLFWFSMGAGLSRAAVVGYNQMPEWTSRPEPDELLIEKYYERWMDFLAKVTKVEEEQRKLHLSTRLHSDQEIALLNGLAWELKKEKEKKKRGKKGK